MQPPNDPRDDEITGLNERRRYNRKRCGSQPHDNEADLAGLTVSLVAGWTPIALSAAVLLTTSRRCERLDNQTCTSEIHRYCEVFDHRVSPESAENVEYVMSVIGQSVGMNNRVQRNRSKAAYDEQARHE